MMMATTMSTMTMTTTMISSFNLYAITMTMNSKHWRIRTLFNPEYYQGVHLTPSQLFKFSPKPLEFYGQKLEYPRGLNF